MHFRRSSNASARVRRSKSSSSVKTHYASPSESENLDPDTTRQLALAAAAAAYGRGGQQDPNRNLARRHSISDCGAERGTGLSRRRSVRFVGPNAPPRRPLTRHYDERVIRHRSSPVRPQVPLGRTYDSEPQPPQDSASGLEGREQIMYLSDGPHTSLDDIASLPSSFRRSQRSRPLSFQAKGFSGANTPGVLVDSHNVGHATGAPDQWREPDVKTSKTGFQSSSPSKTTISAELRPDAVEMARQEFTSNLDEKKPGRQSASLLGELGRPHQKGLRRTVRSSADTQYGAAIASANQGVRPPKTKISARARDFSTKIKSKLKRVFHHSSDKADPMPVQQLEASRPHWGESPGSPYSAPSVYEPDSPLHQGPLIRGPGRVASLRVPSSSVDLQSWAGSVHSGLSGSENGNDKSRVTSWTDSTAANTMIGNFASDYQRLAVISEDGDHPESQLFDPSAFPYTPRYAAFRGAMVAGQDKAPGANAIDCRRVYSALIKKLDERSPGAQLTDETVPGNSGDARGLRKKAFMPLRSISRESHLTDATVMHMPASDNDLHARPKDDVFIPARSDESRLDGRRPLSQLSPGMSVDLLQRDDIGADLDPQMGTADGLMSKESPAGQHSSYTYFPSSTDWEITTPTPRGRRIATASSAGAPDDDEVRSMHIARTTPDGEHEQASLDCCSEHDSNSIYSRSIGSSKVLVAEMVTAPSKSVVRANEDSRLPGGWHSVVRRDASFGSPVSTIATQTQDDILATPRAHGHRRENAQIFSDDVEIGTAQGPGEGVVGLHELVASLRSPELGPLAQISPLRELHSPASNIVDLYRSPPNADKASYVAGAENRKPMSTISTPNTRTSPSKSGFRGSLQVTPTRGESGDRVPGYSPQDDTFTGRLVGLADATNKPLSNRSIKSAARHVTPDRGRQLAGTRLKRTSMYEIASRHHAMFLATVGGKQHHGGVSGSVNPSMAQDSEDNMQTRSVDIVQPVRTDTRARPPADSTVGEGSGGVAFV